MVANEYLNKSIVYAGSDIFSVPSLQRLLDLKYKKITVLTKPPRRQGRGMKVKNNPLAQFSSEQNIEIVVTEQPTGEITAGAGYGTSGQTLSFGIKENNFAGNATRLNTNLAFSAKSVKGGLNVIIPNYNYSDKSLRVNLSRASNDYLSTSGFENTITNFTLGTGFEYKQDLFFTPLIVFEAEDLTTDSTASTALKKQDGNYNTMAKHLAIAGKNNKNCKYCEFKTQEDLCSKKTRIKN